jgi:hypothetical protein
VLGFLLFFFLPMDAFYTHLFRANGSGKGHAACPLPTRNAVADRVVGRFSYLAIFDGAAEAGAGAFGRRCCCWRAHDDELRVATAVVV